MAKKTRFVLRKYSDEVVQQAAVVTPAVPAIEQAQPVSVEVATTQPVAPVAPAVPEIEQAQPALTPEELLSLEPQLAMDLENDPAMAAIRQAIAEKQAERQKQVVALRLSPETIRKAKALGKGYTSVLARMIDYCLNDPEIIKKCF